MSVENDESDDLSSIADMTSTDSGISLTPSTQSPSTQSTSPSPTPSSPSLDNEFDMRHVTTHFMTLVKLCGLTTILRQNWSIERKLIWQLWPIVGLGTLQGVFCRERTLGFFLVFFTSKHTIGYQSFEASRKMTRHQQSLTWHGFDTTSI